MPNAIVTLTSILFVHFTDAVSAAAIVASGQLRRGDFGSVYAAAEGGAYVPAVQQTRLGVAADRSSAVVFRTKTAPDLAFAEEIVWRAEQIEVIDAVVTTADEAAELLDGTAVVEEAGWGEPEMPWIPCRA